MSQANWDFDAIVRQLSDSYTSCRKSRPWPVGQLLCRAAPGCVSQLRAVSGQLQGESGGASPAGARLQGGFSPHHRTYVILDSCPSNRFAWNVASVRMSVGLSVRLQGGFSPHYRTDITLDTCPSIRFACTLASVRLSVRLQGGIGLTTALTAPLTAVLPSGSHEL